MLGLPAAPSFATFLTLTSGLGMDEFNQIWIVGVGLQSVQHAVLPERVQDCDTFSGIAGLWCSCVATYDFERERDQLEQRASCRSEYRHLIPFMVTPYGDDWRFDRSRSSADGENPVVYWDHEQREVQSACPDFPVWLESRFVLEAFGER